MKRVLLIVVCLGLAFSLGARGQDEGATQESQEITFWYHFDDPETAVNPLVEKFEQENPGITVKPERVAWDVYNQKLLTAVAGGLAPDVAQVKLWWQPQLVELDALVPLNDKIAAWEGRDDVFDKIWELTKYKDGNQYYMPLQMVILYLYYRVDMFEELGLSVPKTRAEFLDVAKALTRDTDGDGEIDVYGFGIRGARGGHDWWGTFVLSSGASFTPGGLTNQQAIDANQWFIDLYRVHEVSPPTTPTDGFKEIIANMTSGKTAMTIHHLGSSKTMEEALGDKISAAPVPMGTDGYWTSFGDEENAIFNSDTVDASFAWTAFLATAENNAVWQKASGQVSINKSNAAGGSNRFLKATTDSADFAGVLPAHPGTAEFVESLWPTQMQRAFMGEISSAEMMELIADHFGM